uniref:Uncharacterized protein n=1 Tax=Arundo donax TaxID=35708 RepID=A0A0A8YAA4_ARUDO
MGIKSLSAPTFNLHQY